MAEVVNIASPTYQPAMRVISSITQANPAVVTTSIDHDYGTGEIVRFFFPEPIFGMKQINGKRGRITVTGTTTFEVAIDTTHFDAFSIPAGNRQWPQVLPVGEVNSTLRFATKNVLPSGDR